MSTNEERRQAAKRKLEDRLQQERQAARKRRFIIIGTSAVVVVAVAATAATLITMKVLQDRDNARHTACAYTAMTQDPFSQVPTVPANLPADQQAWGKQYVDELNAGKAKQRKESQPGNRQLKEGTEKATFTTSQGAITMSLDRASAPCNVAAIGALIGDKYFDNTSCHRMTEGDDSGKLAVLQCGDPTGTGVGTPGWTSPDEFPKNLKTLPQDEQSAAYGLPQKAIYPRGSVAIANGYQSAGGQEVGQNTGASQFFIAIKDAQLPPNYSLVGKVDDAGMKVIDKIYAGGVTPGVQPSRDQQTGAVTGFQQTPGDGKPKTPVDISTVKLS
ncbi:peptidylprolyl isomerase [Williamsia sterculiae]|uniref:peptidylprolyl isomerase n=1 Tax=Williamsia sterculiae TaxID=1344003 RepID=UPI00097022AD|nr:peptidylprolyl isomerase [Williamsia sterculiae]